MSFTRFIICNALGIFFLSHLLSVHILSSVFLRERQRSNSKFIPTSRVRIVGILMVHIDSAECVNEGIRELTVNTAVDSGSHISVIKFSDTIQIFKGTCIGYLYSTCIGDFHGRIIFNYPFCDSTISQLSRTVKDIPVKLTRLLNWTIVQLIWCEEPTTNNTFGNTLV